MPFVCLDCGFPRERNHRCPTRCVVCGQLEHRDADLMVERCHESAAFERFEPVFLREL